MSREIKFRAWNSDWKMMVQPEDIMSIHFDGVTANADAVDFNITTTDGQRNKNTWEDWETGVITLMQYTGLKDKNRVEIYEGDVVYIEHPAWTEKCIVEFKNGSFIFRALNGPSEGVVVPGYTFVRETWEVNIVGDIYENPELLTP
jgi:uncharacterized phage protein (TIGR01671 family)